MNLSANVISRMEYIQKVFLKAGELAAAHNDLSELTSLLDSEPPEFRSVAYESASMEIGLRDLSSERPLAIWKEFRQASAKEHTFHSDIGLGWAFAKTGIHPAIYLQSVNQVVAWMVYDGMGYYYGLFKGRNTVKNKKIPEFLDQKELHGFDQGLGRRLWYIAKGIPDELALLISGFPGNRQPDLWRGTGIACGYVGGSQPEDLKKLLAASGKFEKQLKTGVVLAAISRLASKSFNADTDTACRILCNKSMPELKKLAVQMTPDFIYLYSKVENSRWLKEVESILM